jgi:hypothetical protein
MGQGVKLTTHLYLVPRLRMDKATPQFDQAVIALTWLASL